MAGLSMFGSILTKIGDIIAGFFAIIPQALYFLYASVASLLDMFQYVFRKLAGLDVYYVDGTEQSGDMVVGLIEGLLGINQQYSALSTVFWSMIIFGVIVLFLMTIFTIIKAHYNYDARKAAPSYAIKLALKSLATMAIIPACVLLGLYLGSAVFKTLDMITSAGSAASLANVYESEAQQNFAYATTSSEDDDSGTRRYASFDFFGAKEWSGSQTFTGIMFETCSQSANRVRYGAYTPNGDGWDNAGVFYTQNDSDAKETIAHQIDFAFSNNLTLVSRHTFEIAGMDEASSAIASSLTYGPSMTFAAGLINAQSFSKFNVGLVWYYYNLWAFNFILAFLGIAICITLFSNVLFGMLMRIIMAAVMFIIYPPVVGLMPFDEGNATKSWRKEFISYMISAYSAVIAMNIMFLMLPVINSISFFNNSFLDGIMQMLFLIAGLIMVKRFISLIASFVGVKNLDEIGGGLKQEASKPVKRGLNAAIGMGVAAVGFKKLTSAIGQDIRESKLAQKIGSSKPVKAISAGLSKAKASFLKTKAGKFVKATGDKVVKLGNTLKGAGQKVVKAGRKVKGGLNRLLDNSAFKLVAARLGIPTDPNHKSEYMEVEEEDENGKKVKVLRHIDGYDDDGKPVLGAKKQSGLGIIKNAFLDLTGVALTAVGDITGAKNMFDNFAKNNKMLDRAKEEVNEFASTLLKIKSPVFQTAKMQQQKQEEAELRKSPLNITRNSSTSQQTLSVVLKMINDVKKS